MSAPAVFISHGAPSIAIEEDAFTAAVRAYGATLDLAAAVVVSAHWQTRSRMRVNAVARPETIYDFGGFSDELYRIRYEAPGAPELAARVASLLPEAQLETSRGWDHALWVPLRVLFPDARVPLVEVSLPSPATPEQLAAAGRALAPLRDEGIAVIGSGGIVHNLRAIDFGGKFVPPAEWSRAFDDWVFERVSRRDFDAVARYASEAPHAALAVPTPEHFEPLFVVLGAARPDDALRPIHQGFHYGTLSMRAFAFSQ